MRETFPIMAPGEQKAIKAAGVEMTPRIPWAMIAPHEEQASDNHDQSLALLASRGGLSACEAVAVLEDRPWRSMGEVTAYRRLQELVQAWKDKPDGKEADKQAAPAQAVDQG